MTEEWIEHDGKGYPDLSLDTLVEVRFGDGMKGAVATVEEWGINWRHERDWPLFAGDIYAYRVVAK